MSIKDVAKLAGVSPSTVSRVVNGGMCSAASEETQTRIWDAVREVGYSPNQHARSLKKPSRSQVSQPAIDCVYARKAGPFLDPFFTTLMHSAEAEALQLGYVLRYYYSVEDIQSNSFQNMHPEVSSAIVLGRPNPDALEILRQSYKNLVYSGLNELKADLDQVLCSGYKAASICVDYLMSLGHTKICYLGETANEQRYQGFCDAMEKYGISDYENYMIETPFTPAGGYDSVNALLSRTDDFTAIFCANDMSAMGALKALKEHRLKVPRDVSLIGINDMETVRYLDPMLTTVNVALEEMGKMAAKLLIDRIEGGHRIPTKVEFPCSLICRESCGPVRKGSRPAKPRT
ncbi:MAG: LacI family DNA-binding transcriptional regulator [Oscillospiraceae bacterium]|nr:LacI family DNA-binding transcriptional regulator [Oscillospiraceae bacterium]